MRLSLCLLTFNEIDGCRHDVPRLPVSAFEEVFAVDGGSEDGTVAFLEEHGIPVYRQPVKSLNAACRHAAETCTTEALVFFHPKGTVPVDDVLKFRPLFEQGYELVIGSRNGPGGYNEEDEKWLKPRKWLSTMVAGLIALTWRREGPVLWDILHGFRGATIDALRRIDLLPVGVSVDLEMVVRAYRLRLKRVEFPTRETPRIGGGTHFKILPTGRKLLRYLCYELLQRKDS